jgi:hypothetical protein
MEAFRLCVVSLKTNKAIQKYSLRVHGDGKQYQFRIKSNSAQYYSYIYPFQTNGEDRLRFRFKNFPSFRGRKLNQPNFSKDTIEEITFNWKQKKGTL